MTLQTFETLGLAEPLTRALSDAGYSEPTPIQAGAIPAQLGGRDVLGLAQTGTGKTAAFGLPILHRLLLGQKGRPAPRTARALILAPTRELAVQIEQSLKGYARHMYLSTALVLGGLSRSQQIRALARGVDILVATPGRLTDLMAEGRVKLHQTHFLVLDEADRMLDMGFIRDVRRIVQALPKARQSLLFSATMPRPVEALAAEMLHNPVRVEIAAKTVAVDRIEQSVAMVPTPAKRAHLAGMLADPALARVVVFTRTKHGADKVARNLEKDGFEAQAIHGNKSQNARQRALNQFKSGRARILVATDIAARGIDVDGVTHVINYELPDEAESYVHRIGRTARAGADGIAVTLCCAVKERDKLRAVERLLKQPLPVSAVIQDNRPVTPSKPRSGRPAPRPQGQRPRSKQPQSQHLPGERPSQSAGNRPLRRRRSRSRAA